MARVEKTALIEAPLAEVSGRWTSHRFFPRILDGINQALSLESSGTEWPAEVSASGGHVSREDPGRLVEWESDQGAARRALVEFEAQENGRTHVRLSVEYEHQSLQGRLAELVGLVRRRLDYELQEFRAYVEGAEGYAPGIGPSENRTDAAERPMRYGASGQGGTGYGGTPSGGVWPGSPGQPPHSAGGPPTRE